MSSTVDTPDERSSSVTMSECRVVSQCHSFVILLGVAGATCPT